MVLQLHEHGKLQKARPPTSAVEGRKQSLWKRLLDLLLLLCPSVPRELKQGSSAERQNPTAARTFNQSTHPTRPAPLLTSDTSASSTSSPPLLSLRHHDTLSQTLIPSHPNSLHPPPPAHLHPSQRRPHSRFGLRAELARFEADVHAAFLTPLERATLSNLQTIPSNIGHFRPLMNPEAEILIAPSASQALALQEIGRLTRELGEGEKEILRRDLERLLTREQRGVLGRVLEGRGRVGGSGLCHLPSLVEEEEGRVVVREGAERKVADRGGGWGQSRVWSQGRNQQSGQGQKSGIQPPSKTPRLRLRGGGSEDEPSISHTGLPPRSNTILIIPEPTHPAIDTASRPPALLWWLAGGRGRAPSFEELRVRRRVEVANREVVGFLGTLLGVREERKTRREVREEMEREEEKEEEEKAEKAGKAGKAGKKGYAEEEKKVEKGKRAEVEDASEDEGEDEDAWA